MTKPLPPGSGLRARVRDREGYVRACMAIMREAKWVRGKSDRELAARWKLPLSTLQGYSGEAWRRLAAEENPSEVRVLCSETLRTVIAEAMVETRTPALIEGPAGRDGEPRVFQESPNGARRIVVEAAKTLAALVGAGEPTKVEFIGEPQTRAEKLAAYAAMKAEIAAEEEALLAEECG